MIQRVKEKKWGKKFKCTERWEDGAEGSLTLRPKEVYYYINCVCACVCVCIYIKEHAYVCLI